MRYINEIAGTRGETPGPRLEMLGISRRISAPSGRSDRLRRLSEIPAAIKISLYPVPPRESCERRVALCSQGEKRAPKLLRAKDESRTRARERERERDRETERLHPVMESSRAKMPAKHPFFIHFRSNQVRDSRDPLQTRSRFQKNPHKAYAYASSKIFKNFRY